MKKVLYSLLILLTSWQINYAQVDSGNLETYLNNYTQNLPGANGDDYAEPTVNQLNDWGQTITHLLNQNLNAARVLANTFNYKIVEYTDLVNLPGQLYYVLEEKSPRTNHWGVYVFNSNPCRTLLNLQAPHPKKDTNTDKQATYCFTRLNAHSLAISGTHRCNHSDTTDCSGVTGTCAPSTKFRVSDVAHNDEGVFHKTTEIIASVQAQSIFVQLHGFAKKPSDPYAIISNGTTNTPITDYIQSLRAKLFQADNTLTFKSPHIELGWIRLAGFTNTQGRLLNGSNNPCKVSAPNASGRFIQIEQEKSKLRANASGWHKVFKALSNVFFCTNNARKTKAKQGLLNIYPNPSATRKFTVVGQSITRLYITNVNGVAIFDQSYDKQSKVVVDAASLPKGMYFITIISNHQQYTKKITLK